MYHHDDYYYTEWARFRLTIVGAGNLYGTDAAASMTEDGDGSMMDVRCRFRPQQILSIFVLLLRLKGTSIQLVQGSRWVSGLSLEGEQAPNWFSSAAAAARASRAGFFSWMPRYPWQLFAPQWHLTFSPKCTNL